ncbi:MAG: hypothetical protein JXB32_12640, partial [Deltaproteobacteria bacterium]|nr:hypothetical protein [Deltaproteobacteria bacterium]
MGLALLLLGGCSGGETVLGERDGGTDADAEDVERDEGGDGGDSEAAADACVPNCEGRECGDDGCGGTCPPGCSDGEVCRTPPGECVAARGWVEVPPPPRPSGAMAYDSGRSVLVLFGGTPDAGDYPADTWEFDGTTWTEVAPTVSPSGRSGAAMAYDRTRGVVVLFGGVGADGTLADTWEYDGTNWREIVTTVSPTGRRECMMTCDVDRGVVVLFGGIGAEGMLADTWEYDGTDWSEISPTTSPPARTDGAMVYDEARSVVMLLGGRGAHDLNDAWEYDGTTWSPVGVPVDESPGRRGAAMAYDSSRGVIVLFGGSHFGGSGELFYGDTWEYDGAAWTQVATSREPPARCHHAMW